MFGWLSQTFAFALAAKLGSSSKGFSLELKTTPLRDIFLAPSPFFSPSPTPPSSPSSLPFPSSFSLDSLFSSTSVLLILRYLSTHSGAAWKCSSYCFNLSLLLPRFKMVKVRKTFQNYLPSLNITCGRKKLQLSDPFLERLQTISDQLFINETLTRSWSWVWILSLKHDGYQPKCLPTSRRWSFTQSAAKCPPCPSITLKSTKFNIFMDEMVSRTKANLVFMSIKVQIMTIHIPLPMSTLQ